MRLVRNTERVHHNSKFESEEFKLQSEYQVRSIIHQNCSEICPYGSFGPEEPGAFKN